MQQRRTEAAGDTGGAERRCAVERGDDARFARDVLERG
jgi:hypothetical protein